ncbi:Gustatory receptor 169 [Halyomorpha halys]|nr:Gustatory receptor 169 [Halyomorpha halys]
MVSTNYIFKAFHLVNRIIFLLPLTDLKGISRKYLVYSLIGLSVQMSIHFYYQVLYSTNMKNYIGLALHTLIYLTEQIMLVSHYLSFRKNKMVIRLLLKRVKDLIPIGMEFRLFRANFCFCVYCITEIITGYNYLNNYRWFGICVTIINFQIFMIIMQFVYCLDILCEIFSDLLGDLNSAEPILLLQIELHQYFIRLCQKTNTFFSVTLVIAIPKLFLTIISSFQETLQLFFSSKDFSGSIFNSIYLFQNIFLAFTLSDVCSRTKEQVDRFIFALSTLNSKINMNNDIVKQYLLSRPTIEFEARGFLKISYSLFTLIISISVTYVVILVKSDINRGF